MTRAPAPFPLERLADIPERPEDFRLLERIPLTREPQSWPLNFLLWSVMNSQCSSGSNRSESLCALAGD